MSCSQSLHVSLLCLLHVVVWLNLCAGAEIVTKVVNDDYCDLLDGSDEWSTSACAGVSGAPEFVCHGSGILNITIPPSRVQDGVCDCCDGEDEVGSPFVKYKMSDACPNKCSEQLLNLKINTLTEYKAISAGLRAKADTISTLNRKKLREKQSYDGLLQEYTEIQKLYFQIKYWLDTDSKVESRLMFKELRARVRKCADGFFEACDYFRDGSNPLYETDTDFLYDFPELWDEQGPIPDTSDVADDEIDGKSDDMSKQERKLGNLDPKKLGNSPHRKKYNSVSEKIDEVIKKNQAKDKAHSQLTGPQRIENSFCSFDEMDAVGLLGGEESIRVHKNVLQYLTWLSGKGGRASRKLTTEQKRSKNTLFGAYLDSGSEGYVVGMQALMELIGIILSPVTVTYTELTLFYIRNKKALFQRAQACVVDDDPEMRETIWMRPPDTHLTADYIPCNNIMIWPFRFLLWMSDQSSPVSIVLSYLDYNNYEWFMNLVVARAAPYVNSYMWYFRIIQQAPYYYYRFYFGDGASKLPVYRNACILREGLRVAKIESTDIKAKIQAKKQQVEAEGGVVDNSIGSDGRVTSSNGGGILSSFASFSSAESSEGVDFGPDGSWQALNDTCLTRHEGQYVYKVCVFREIFQDQVKLGMFSHWGDKPRTSDASRSSESKMADFKSKLRNKKAKSPSEYLSKLVPGKSEAVEDPPVSYTKQYYGGGTACHNGIIRHAVLEFSCASFPEIVDVVEYEMCGYYLRVNTPMACTRDMEVSLLRKLQQLDVYGFGTGSSKDEEIQNEDNANGAENLTLSNEKSEEDNSLQDKSEDEVTDESEKHGKLHSLSEEDSETLERESEDSVAYNVKLNGDSGDDEVMHADVNVVEVEAISAPPKKKSQKKSFKKKIGGGHEPYRVVFNDNPV